MSSDKKNREKSHDIVAVMIIEVLGKPKEHLIETLEKLVTDIDNEPGVSVVEKTIHEPKELEKKPGMFTSYAEIEVEVEQALQLAILMFKYMPAHIDIIEPENIVLTNFGYGDILNELTRRLHKYDEVARVIQMERQILENQLKKYMPKEDKK